MREDIIVCRPVFGKKTLITIKSFESRKPNWRIEFGLILGKKPRFSNDLLGVKSHLFSICECIWRSLFKKKNIKTRPVLGSWRRLKLVKQVAPRLEYSSVLNSDSPCRSIVSLSCLEKSMDNLSPGGFPSFPPISEGKVFLGIHGGGVPTGSPNPGHISDLKIVACYTRFKTWCRQKLCYRYWLRLERQQKHFVKAILNLPITSFFLVHLELKRQTRPCVPKYPRFSSIPTKINKV